MGDYGLEDFNTTNKAHKQQTIFLNKQIDTKWEKEKMMSCEGEIESKNDIIQSGDWKGSMMSYEVEIDRLLTGINVGIVVGSCVNLLPN
jgi:hypothetical protein